MAKLRAVQPGEQGKRLSVSEAAARSDRRALLLALEVRLAAALEDPACHPTALAALSRRLVEVGKEIAAFDAAADVEAGPVAVASKSADAPWSADDI